VDLDRQSGAPPDPAYQMRELDLDKSRGKQPPPFTMNDANTV